MLIWWRRDAAALKAEKLFCSLIVTGVKKTGSGKLFLHQ